ncbi:hypothetical protein C7B80_21800 [Cyanosarcina cf. burmensis CCALA 770]|nr:hypothetical protein C7B80_21800 [Cyanosarcina cf. burmensis CCALA 770]
MKSPTDEPDRRILARTVTRCLCIGSLAAIATLTLPGMLVPNGSPVAAEIVEEYVPPPGSQRSQRTSGSGSRSGCPLYNNTQFHLLVPNDRVATTATKSPAFFAYVSEADVPLALTVAKLKEPPSTLYKKSLQLKQPGITKFEIPKERPLKLQEGEEYRLTLSIICNSKRPSKNPYVQVDFKYVPPSLALQQQLQANSGNRAKVYARSGIWYDALAASYQSAILSARNEQSESDFFAHLLNQIGISSEVAEQVKHRIEGNIVVLK